LFRPRSTIPINSCQLVCESLIHAAHHCIDDTQTKTPQDTTARGGAACSHSGEPAGDRAMAPKVTISSPRNVLLNVEVRANLGMVDLSREVLGFGVPTM
jgi:hypothetical protein